MAGIPISDEACVAAFEARSRHRTAAAAAKELGITTVTLNNRLQRAASRGLDGSLPEALPPGQQVKGVSTLWGLDQQGEWIEKLKWVKSKEDANLQKLIEALQDAFSEYKGKSELISPPKIKDTELLSVYPIADQHVGLLSWGKETGEDYDLDIGARRLHDCAKRLISQSPSSASAIILNLGDFQHTDDAKNMTPAHGNLLDVDGRYVKVLTVGVQMMMDTIDLALQKHDKVLVRNIPGNHDPHASVALTVALSAFYHNNQRVTIDDDPSEFFFHRFGQSLIGANHGHRMKPADMAMLLAARRAEDWGQTKFKHFYFGHIHHVTAKEIGGVVVESFQTLAAKDAWSHARGFTARQSLSSITFHHEDGEIGRHRVNI